MKKITSIFLAISFVFLLSNFTNPETPNISNPEDVIDYRVPRKMNNLIQESCYGCHNSDSKNDKGKKKLDFDKIGKEYNTIKSAGILRDISKALTEGEMPPEKFLKHYPEKALTKADAKMLSDWASFESSRLQGK